MFELFYEMKHTPFTRGIPTSVLCKTHQSSEVFSRLKYTVKNQLFAVLIGEPGTGKTSTLRRLKDELPEAEYMVLYISDSKLTPRSFYNYLLIQLGCKSEFLRNTTREDRATLGSDLSASWDFAGSICSLYLKLTSPLGGVSLFSADLSLTKYSACP